MPAPTTAFSQRDARWSGVTLGGGPDTIGADGCYLTAQAMILASMGLQGTPPPLLNKIYLAHGDCFGDGCDECLHMEAPQRAFPQLIDAVGLYDCSNSPCDLHQLDNSAPLIFKCVEFDLGNGATHFCPVYDGTRGAQSTILDPWQVPASVQPLTLYGSDPTRSILKVITYKKAVPLPAGGPMSQGQMNPAVPGRLDFVRVLPDKTVEHRWSSDNGATWPGRELVDPRTDPTTGDPVTQATDAWCVWSSDGQYLNVIVAGVDGNEYEARLPFQPPPGSAPATFAPLRSS